LIAKEELKEDNTMSIASEVSRMSFELARHSIDRSISLDKKAIDYKKGVLERQSMKMN